MIQAIADGLVRWPMAARSGGADRPVQRRRRRTILTREHVSITPEAADMAALALLDDEATVGGDVAVAETAAALAGAPRLALAAQARVSAALARRLIAVNGVNPL